MNIIKLFNQTIEYIETTLEDKVDEKKISQLSGYSYPMFSRIFSILTGYSLSEYIRLRRLTKAAFDVKDISKTKKLGLDIMEIPEAEYAIVKLKGKVPDCIHEGWKYVMEVFFPEHNYKHAGTPDFEFYSEGDMESDNYEMELWVPIVKTK